MGECEGGRFVITTPSYYKGEVGFIITSDGTIPCDKSVLQIRPQRFYKKRSGRQWITPGLKGKRVFVPSPKGRFPTGRRSSMEWELIYNGKDHDVIFVGYREFMNNFARPAFSQELRYDLSESRNVVFRNVELEVVEASNNAIKFKILHY